MPFPRVAPMPSARPPTICRCPATATATTTTSGSASDSECGPRKYVQASDVKRLALEVLLSVVVVATFFAKLTARFVRKTRARRDADRLRRATATATARRNPTVELDIDLFSFSCRLRFLSRSLPLAADVSQRRNLGANEWSLPASTFRS